MQDISFLTCASTARAAFGGHDIHIDDVLSVIGGAVVCD